MSCEINRIGKIISMLLYLLFLSACFHFEPSQSGIVLDAVTLKPIENVIVFRELYRTCFLPPNPGGPNCYYLGHNELVTDRDGKYTLPMGINLLPPLICFTDEPILHYAKDGYFIKRGHPEKDVRLFKMTHYLNFRPLVENYENFISFTFREKSELVKKSKLAQMRSIQFNMAGELGVFSRIPGKKFTKIFASSDHPFSSRNEIPPGHMIYLAYDDIGREWTVLDGRGEQLDVLPKDVPKFDFINFDGYDFRPYFADKNEIFYMASSQSSPLPVDIFTKFPYYIQKVKLHQGGVSAISGDLSIGMYTIENNGTELCQYGGAGRTDKEGNRVIPHLLSVLKSSDLPETGEDDTIKQNILITYISLLTGSLL